MNAVEIEEAVSALAERPFDAGEFPFQFLEAFGNKETTIKRLRAAKGSTNASDLPGAVLQRSNIHIAVADPGEVSAAFAALKASPATVKAKAQFILATDGDTFEAEDLASGETVACPYVDFPNHFGFFLPLAGISTVKQVRDSAFDIRATARLNRLYVELLKDNPDWGTAERRAEMNHFMARLIFCFFAEDTDIFHGEGLFTATVDQMSAKDSGNTHEVIGELFRAMNTPIKERDAAGIRSWANVFPYVNGGLFSGSLDVPRFSRIARSYLIHIGNLKWTQINPDIFGSMIQAVADDEERGALGMHYTSRPNILKVLNPLFLDDLRGSLEEAGDNARKLLNLRNRMARTGHSVSPGEIAIGVIIGRTSEFFDFFVYAIASVLVFPGFFFPFVEPLTGTLYSFIVFALAFVARPVGSFAFMAIDRAYGRGAKLTIALFLLGGSTAAIAFLPSYRDIGALAIALLALFRMGQGFALGGTWDGLASLLALNAPEGRRGWYAMIPQLGAPLGLIVASLLFAFFTSSLPAADFLDWGWRFPFFVAFAINVVALFARLRLVVTPEFQRLYETRDLQPERVGVTLRLEWKTIVIGAFAPLASFALFHMVTVFPLSWVFLFTEEAPTRFLLIEAGAAALGVVAIVASGRLADHFGRRQLLGASAAVIAVFSGFAPQLLALGEAGEIVFMLSGFLLLGLAFGQSSGAVSSNFATQNRYTGSAITSDLAWLFGAGFAPLVALWLSANFGLLASGGYLLSGALATMAALWFNNELGRAS